MIDQIVQADIDRIRQNQSKFICFKTVCVFLHITTNFKPASSVPTETSFCELQQFNSALAFLMMFGFVLLKPRISITNSANDRIGHTFVCLCVLCCMEQRLPHKFTASKNKSKLSNWNLRHRLHVQFIVGSNHGIQDQEIRNNVVIRHQVSS